MSFGSRLREKREELGLKQSELGKMLGITGSAIGNYENGISSPKADILYRVFDVLKCDANFLFQDEMDTLHNATATPHEMEHLIKKYRLLDPLGKEAVDSILDIEHRRCLTELKQKRDEGKTETSEEFSGETIYFTVPEYSLPMSAGTGHPAGDEWAEDLLLTKAPPRGTSFVASVSGDSMEPTYRDGDRLFIHSTLDIYPGQIGVFLMDGNQWIKEFGENVLISHNKKYTPIPFTEDIQCQGLVLGICDDSYFD